MKNRFTLPEQPGQQDKETELSKNSRKDKGPSDKVMKNIMNYSRSLVVLKSKLNGTISLILN